MEKIDIIWIIGVALIIIQVVFIILPPVIICDLGTFNGSNINGLYHNGTIFIDDNVTNTRGVWLHEFGHHLGISNEHTCDTIAWLFGSDLGYDSVTI